MDKVEKFTASKMISEFYSDTIRKAIAIYIAKDIHEIESSLIMESKNLSKEVLYTIKNKVLVEILKTEKVKQILLFGIDKLVLNRDDILSEILKQYGIDDTFESTFYHDKLKIVFSEYIDIFSCYIKNERMDLLYLHLKDCL